MVKKKKRIKKKEKKKEKKKKVHPMGCTLTLEVILWAKLYCLLFQKSSSDVSNFDTDFTMEKAQLTPPDKEFMRTMDQEVFAGFSFTNTTIATKT